MSAAGIAGLMRDLISPDELARFWVRTATEASMQHVLDVHAVDEQGRCQRCRSTHPCLFGQAAEQAGVELHRRLMMRVFRR